MGKEPQNETGALVPFQRMLNALEKNMSAKLSDSTLDSLDEIQEENSKETVVLDEEDKVKEIVPEKYRGKSIEDIVKMHQESEKLIGRQGQELGDLKKEVELRKYIEEHSKKQADEEKEEDLDFFANPKEAIDRQVGNHPAVKAAREAAEGMKRAETLARLKEAHPDISEIAQDESFVDWVKASPVRLELYGRAESFDFNAADNLLSTWKERKEASKKVAETSALDRKQQLKAASSISTGSLEPASKKILRREDIRALIQKDPDRYEALYPEIERAYLEGRVR